MKPFHTAMTALALAAFAAVPAHADKGKYKNNRHASPAYGHCPPGLAKKNPPCVPPGLAKKRYDDHTRYRDHYRYRTGDRIDRDYIILRHPERYRLDPRQTYYRVGDSIYRVDRETRKVLDFVGAAAALMQ